MISFTINKESERDYTKRELDILKVHFHDLVEYIFVDDLDFLSYLNTGLHQSLHKQERNHLAKGIYALLAAIYLDQYSYEQLERFIKDSVVTEEILERFKSIKISHETECCFGTFVCKYKIDGNTFGCGEGGDEFEAELDAK